MSDIIRAKRLLMSKDKLVDIIEGMEQDENDNEERLNDFWDAVPFDDNQILFEPFMDWARQQSWDIPSALGSVCSHTDDSVNGGDFFMHRDQQYWSENNWDQIDYHFKNVHGLDLNSPKINWSFDT